jgi:outer membrane protein assembly factor BamB
MKTGVNLPAIRLRYPLLLILSILSCTVVQVTGADWPQWRGPNRDAKSSETGLLQSWPESGPQLKWKTSELGAGYASLVVANGRLHTIGSESGSIFAYAFDEQSGDQLWKTQIGESSRHAMSTPTVDGEYLYALDPDGELCCLHAATGELQWQVDFISDFQGKLQSGRGYGESPLIDGKHLICTPGGDQAMIVALNKATGEVIWKMPAPELGTKGGDGASFSSIVKTQVEGIEMYVQLIGRGLIGVECKTGKYLWGYNDICADIVNIPTPIVRGDLVFSANGYNAGSVLLKLTSKTDGEVEASEVYRLQGNQFQNHHGGVVAVGDSIIAGHGSNNGLPTCLDLESGEIHWKRRGPGVGSAAVIHADNRFIFRYQNGVVALIEADPSGFTIHGKLQIPGAGGDSWSHPVLANGCLFLREQDSIYVHDVTSTNPSNSDPERIIEDSFSDQVKQALDDLSVSHVSVGMLDSQNNVIENQQFYGYGRSTTEKTPAIQLPVVRLELKEDRRFDQRVLDILSQTQQEFVIDCIGIELTPACVRQLSGLPKLVGLDLQLCRGLTNDVLMEIGKLTTLRALRLAGTEIGDSDIHNLTSLKNLQSLDLEVCEGISDASMPEIAKLVELRCLILKKTAFEKLKLTDVGLAALKPLGQLEVLSLYGNRVTNEGMQYVAEFEKLRVLDLSLVGINDSGVQALSPLEDLEQLYLLYNTGFAGPLLTDQCIPTIQSFEKLQHLNLVGAKVTDESVDRLLSLKDLSELEIQYSRISTTGIMRLQQGLPETKITQ